MKYFLLAFLGFLAFSMTGQDLQEIHHAALIGNIDAIEKHIEKGTDINEADVYGSYPILLATTFGHAAIVESLAGAGADLGVLDAYGSTSLHLAALFGRVDIARILIEHGANRYALNHNGATPYDIAAAPYDRDSKLYEGLLAQLGPLGLKVDLNELAYQRDTIADLLRPSDGELISVDLSLPGDSPWPSIEPIEAGMTDELVAELFYDAEFRPNIYGIIILKDDLVVAEKYFHGHTADQLSLVQSVTKSYFATLVGIAIERGCISSIDQKMLDFFPEFESRLRGTPKAEITIRQLLQMRAGYPWEEIDQDVWKRFINGVEQFEMIATLDLVSEPAESFNYSNLSNYILGIIVSRACGVDLRSFAQEYLLIPTGSGPGEWYRDTLGYYYSLLSFTARDIAALGQLYINEGFAGDQSIITPHWCADALDGYSPDAWVLQKGQQNIGRYMHDLNYGYQWWSADIAGKRIPFAWGHGGQMVFILDDLNLVVAVMSDPQWRKHDPAAWQAEQSSFNLIGKFLTLLIRNNS